MVDAELCGLNDITKMNTNYLRHSFAYLNDRSFCLF